MKTKNLLLLIDMQNDFCQPNGALYVDGAEKDIKNLCKFIKKNEAFIDEIVLTQDTHHVIDISHPVFWENQSGQNPRPYTSISMEDISNGTWIPNYNKEISIQYIKSLYEQGEFPHVIWPEHCIQGSFGAAIVDEVMEAVKNWARRGNNFEIIQKGLNPNTEHFGALRANIPIENDHQTLLNQNLFEKFNHAEKIYVAGEAKSHCVANTIKQMCELDNIANKIVLLEDTMSDVKGFEKIALPIYKKAGELGMQINTTDNCSLN